MLDKNLWVEDPKVKDHHYSIKKNITGKYLYAQDGAYVPYKVIKQVRVLPPEILKIIAQRRPGSVPNITKIIPRAKKERELQRVREAIARFVKSEDI